MYMYNMLFASSEPRERTYITFPDSCKSFASVCAVIIILQFCNFHTVCMDNDLRIVNGTIDREGRLEICVSGSYLSVCDDLWDMADAEVACRQLQYSTDGEVLSLFMYVL